MSIFCCNKHLLQQSSLACDLRQVLDEINEQTDQMQQIQDAMAQPIGPAADMDEDELLGELEVPSLALFSLPHPSHYLHDHLAAMTLLAFQPQHVEGAGMDPNCAVWQGIFEHEMSFATTAEPGVGAVGQPAAGAGAGADGAACAGGAPAGGERDAERAPGPPRAGGQAGQDPGGARAGGPGAGDGSLTCAVAPHYSALYIAMLRSAGSSSMNSAVDCGVLM